MYGTWLEYLVHEVHQTLHDKYKSLPPKAKSEVFVYWLLVPTHVAFGEDNMRRIKFNQCLESVLKLKQYASSMRLIRLKEFSDQNDQSLVKNGSLTEHGLDVYWRSFDSAIGYNVQKREAFLVKTTQQGHKRRFPDNHLGNGDEDIKKFFKKYRNDQFHWHNVVSGEDRAGDRINNRFWLPQPC